MLAAKVSRKSTQLASKILQDAFDHATGISTRVSNVAFPNQSFVNAKEQLSNDTFNPQTPLQKFTPLANFQLKVDNNITSSKDKNTAKALSHETHALLQQATHAESSVSPLQQQLIPHLLSSNCDAIVESAPHTGKTLTYLVPVVNNFLKARENLHEPLLKTPALWKGLKVDDVRRASNVGALILVGSLQNVWNVTQTCKQLLGEMEQAAYEPVRVVGFGSEKMDVNYNHLFAAENPDAHVLVATPEQVLEALQRQWIHLASTQTLVIDDANVLIQSAEQNWERVAQVLRALPTQQECRRLVFGDYISDDMISALRPYLKTLSQDILLFKGETDAWKNTKFDFVKVEESARLARLKEIVSTEKNVAIFTENPQELHRALSSNGTDGIINLAAPRDEIIAQLSQSPQANVFITNDAGIGSPFLSNTSTVVSYDFTSLGYVVARSASAGASSPTSIVFYSSNTAVQLLEPVSEFFQALNKPTPAGVPSKNNEIQRLRQQEQQADTRLIQEVIVQNPVQEQLYAKVYGQKHLLRVRGSSQANRPSPYDWEWRHPETFVRERRVQQKDALKEAVAGGIEIDKSRRVYAREKREKNRQIWLAKREKRRAKGEEEEEDE